MIHHGIHAALARERMNTFLAQAEAGRLARRPGRPARGRRVRPRDRSAVLIRPVRPADDGLLANGFARLRRPARWTTPAGAAWAAPGTPGSSRRRPDAYRDEPRVRAG